MSWNKKQTHMRKKLKCEDGAAVVEFAVALQALLLFFAIFMLLVQIFIAHEHLQFAGFVASRTYAVKGSGLAMQAAVSVIDSEASIQLEPGAILLKRGVPVPDVFRSIFTSGRPEYEIENRTPVFNDYNLLRSLSGDN